MASKILGRLRQLRTLPERAISMGEKHLIAQLPVYTGTYRDALKVDRVEGGLSLNVGVPSLLSAGARNAPSHDESVNPVDYVHEIVHPRFGKPDTPSGPYPLRIEEHGAPKQDGKGQGAWAESASVVGQYVRGEVGKGL